MNSFGVPQKHTRKQFSVSEDHRLKELVKVYGEDNWATISRMMGQRNARQCRDRYKNYLSPNINIGPWTVDEDMKLDSLVQLYGKKWSKLVQYFPRRTEINLKCHYSMIERRKRKTLLIQTMPVHIAPQFQMQMQAQNPPKENIESPQETSIFDIEYDNFDEFLSTLEF